MNKWCRRCGADVITNGTSPLSRAVHAATGDERGPDGHLVTPVSIDPALSATADRVEGRYGPRWRVIATEDGRLQIELRNAGSSAMPPHYATSEQEACSLLDIMTTGAAR